MKHFESEDIKKVRELGFKIEEVNDYGHEFEVQVRIPDSNQTLKSFSFSRTNGEDWEKEVKWVENGEVHEMPRWKKSVKDRLERMLDAIEQQQESSEISNYEGERMRL